MQSSRGRLRSIKLHVGINRNKGDFNWGTIAFKRFNSTSEIAQGKWIISLLQPSRKIQSNLNNLVKENYVDIYNNVNKLNPKSIIPPSLLKLANYKPYFHSIPALGPLVEGGYMKEAMDLILKQYKEGKYLQFNELERLVIYVAPYPWYAYEIVCLYKNRVDWNNANEQLLPLILKLAFFHLDFKFFNEIFERYSKSRNFNIPTNLLILALQVYLKMGNVQVAVQMFNQYVLSDPEPNQKLLTVFLSNLYNVTNNPSLCFTSYQLWVSHGYPITLTMDSFIYNIILEYGTDSQKSWLENSLIERRRFDSVAIQFGAKVSLKYGKSRKLYFNMLENEDLLNELKMRSLDEDSYSSLLHTLLFLHLRHQNYPYVYSTINEFQSRSEFNTAVFSIIGHLEKIERPDLIFEFLAHIRSQCQYKFDFRHFIPYWRSAINKYIHSGDRIHTKFTKAIKSSKYNSLNFLLKVCKVRQMNKSSIADCRWYPKFQLNDIDADASYMTAKPFAKNIQAQMYNGILPNIDLLWKSILLSDNDEDLSQLSEIVKKMNEFGVKSSKIDRELFWKDRKSGQWMPADEFIHNQLRRLETKMQNAPSNISDDLIALFHIAVKFNRVKEGTRILNTMKKYEGELYFNINNSNLIFISMYIKWCFLRRQFTDLVLVLEWLKISDISLDGFFVDGLRKSCEINVQKMIASFENEYGIGEGRELDEVKHEEYLNEKKRLTEVMPTVLNYYDKITMELHKKVRDDRAKALEACGKNFKLIIKWMDEDVENLLLAVQEFKRP